MNISEVCTREVVTCTREAAARVMAEAMREGHVGDVVVVDRTPAGPVPVGIVTDRDLVVKVLAKGVAPELVTAGDLMGDKLITVLASESVRDAIWHLRGSSIRRLPVVDAHGILVGVVSVDDLHALLAAQLTELARIAPCQANSERRALGASH